MDVPDAIDLSLFDAIEARQPLHVLQSIVQERPESVRVRPSRSDRYDEGITALHWAAHKNLPVDSVWFLYNAWPEALREVDSHGYNPIHWLVDRRTVYVVAGGENGSTNGLETAKFLIGQCSEEALLQPNRYGGTPLCVAATTASLPPELFRLLVERSPAQLLRERCCGELLIHRAVRFGLRADSVRALLDAAPESIGEKDDDEKTPLYHAALRENVPLVQLLIERGPRALLLERDTRGRVQLHWVVLDAGRGGGDTSVSIVKALIDACPESVRLRGDDGCLPLHLAAKCGNVGLARLLVGSWPESVREADDPSGRLPLHYVAASEQDDTAQLLETAQFLIHEWPESIREQDRMGRTLLHVAVLAAWGAEDPAPLLDFIIERAPECLQVQDRQGRLPLHLAEVPGIARRLLEAWPPAAHVQDRVGSLPVHCMLMRVASSRPDEEIGEVDEDRKVSRLHAARVLAESWPDSLLVPNQMGRLALHVLLERDAGRGAALAPVWVPWPPPPPPLRHVVLAAGQAVILPPPPHVLLEHDEDASPAPDEVAALEVARYLVETRPRTLQVRDRQGRVPLYVWAACWTSSVDVAPVLVDPWPESLLAADHEGRLPLHVLLERDDASLDRARLLVETNPEPLRIQDHRGRLPLHVLVSQPDASQDITRLLIEAHSGSLQVQDRQGQVPLLAAVTNQDPSLEMVRLLVKACPQSIQSLNPQGLLPLQAAAAHDAPLDIVYFLARQRPELLRYRRSTSI